MKNLLTINIEEKIANLINRNTESIKIFFILFAINILIYGQKLFFYSMPADDYMRYYGDDNTNMLITNSARWAQAFLNNYVFAEKLQILPYLHGLIGIFSFSLMGFMTLYYLKARKPLELLLGGLLVSATPMLAHNLFFSTNITAWITLLFGVIGFLLLYKKSWLLKALGFILILIAIANYQTIIQILVLMILFKAIMDLMELNDFKGIRAIVIDSLVKIFFILIAYILSYKINIMIMDHYHLVAKHRLAQSEVKLTLEIFMDRISQIYTSSVKLRYFQHQLYTLYKISALFAIIGTIFYLLSRDIKIKLKTTILLLILILFSIIPILIHLPWLMGVDIPPRAHFAIGWVVGAFFILQYSTLKGIFKTISILLSIAIIVVSIYYITIFFDSGIRQTTSDIDRARYIVARIRSDKNYTREPIGLNIFGGRKFNVLGWDMKYEQPFTTHWAKYKIFRYFTDLDFHEMTHHEMLEMQDYIVKHYDHIYSYPGKNSIIMHNGNAIVFFYSNYINKDIEDYKKSLISKKQKSKK